METRALMIAERKEGRLVRIGERTEHLSGAAGREDTELVLQVGAMRRRAEQARTEAHMARMDARMLRRRAVAAVRVAAGCGIILCVSLTTVFGICGLPWWACVLPTAAAAGTAKAVGWL